MSAPAANDFGNLCHLPHAAGLRENQVGPCSLWRDIFPVHRLDRSLELFLYRRAVSTPLRHVPMHAPFQAALGRDVQENGEVEEPPKFTPVQEPEPLNQQKRSRFDEAVPVPPAMSGEIVNGQARKLPVT